jgi:hypothetical protein
MHHILLILLLLQVMVGNAQTAARAEQVALLWETVEGPAEQVGMEIYQQVAQVVAQVDTQEMVVQELHMAVQAGMDPEVQQGAVAEMVLVMDSGVAVLVYTAKVLVA